MQMKKIAFIDGNINIDYINESMMNKHRLAGVWHVLNNKVIPTKKKLSEELSHATLCTKLFLDHVDCACELFFINIWETEQNMSRANIEYLRFALFWCLEHDISVINLSIGTTLITDVARLYDITHHLVKNNTIIIAASANNEKMTFPASFEHIIGVRALSNSSRLPNYIYNDVNIDGINVSCLVPNKIITYKEKQYPLYDANSLATPIITAQICHFLNEGCTSLAEIKVNAGASSPPPPHAASPQASAAAQRARFRNTNGRPIRLLCRIRSRG